MELYKCRLAGECDHPKCEHKNKHESYLHCNEDEIYCGYSAEETICEPANEVIRECCGQPESECDCVDTVTGV